MKKSDTSGLRKYQKAILNGFLAGILTIIVLLMLMSLAMSFRDLPRIMIDPIVVVILSLGTLLSGLVSARLSREKGMMIGFTCGFIMFLVITILSLCNKSFSFGYLAMVKFFALTLFGSIGGIWGVNLRSKRK